MSLMERLVGLLGPDVVRLLTVQHRMNTAIMGFSNEEFYGGQLWPRNRSRAIGFAIFPASALSH